MTQRTADLKSRPEASGGDDLYQRDFYRWTVSQARALRNGRWDEIDWENVAEEVESVGRNDRRAVESHLEILIAHLLKCIVQPERWTESWDHTIRAQRQAIAKLLRRNPSLVALPAERFSEAHAEAIFLAHRETGMDEDQFPQDPPFTVEEALSRDFFPGSIERPEE